MNRMDCFMAATCVGLQVDFGYAKHQGLRSVWCRIYPILGAESDHRSLTHGPLDIHSERASSEAMEYVGMTAVLKR
jgi:hypothetical protein